MVVDLTLSAQMQKPEDFGDSGPASVYLSTLLARQAGENKFQFELRKMITKFCYEECAWTRKPEYG